MSETKLENQQGNVSHPNLMTDWFLILFKNDYPPTPIKKLAQCEFPQAATTKIRNQKSEIRNQKSEISQKYPQKLMPKKNF
jgi:hypothetical protein